MPVRLGLLVLKIKNMNTKTLLELYQEMVLLRHFDDMCRKLKLKDIVWSGYHPYTGQEAVAAGCCSQLRQDDCLLGGHRSHCQAVAKGSSVREVLSEMMGRQSGVSGGLGGCMQFIHKETNFESTPITTHFSSVHLPAAAKTLEFS